MREHVVTINILAETNQQYGVRRDMDLIRDYHAAWEASGANMICCGKRLWREDEEGIAIHLHSRLHRKRQETNRLTTTGRLLMITRFDTAADSVRQQQIRKKTRGSSRFGTE